jgi:NADPH:quinone reductase-like Zn-dependent oxidoreductase
MRAIVQTTYSPTAEALSLGELPVPNIEPNEVLVRVHAAGLDRGTWHLMAGQPYAVRLAGFGVRAPKRPVPGIDLAGVVAAVGSDVTRFAIGDEVVGIGRGSFAEYAAAREDKLSLRPASFAPTAAAALPVSGITALMGLTDIGRLQAGQHVLITGASGGVGTYAVQIAHALGAQVTGVCSGGKADLVRSIGADHVIDYQREDFTSGSDRYDLILDLAGNTPLRRLRRVLTARGTLVIGGGEGGGRWFGGIDRQLRAVMLSPFVRQHLAMFVAKEHHRYLDRLLEFVAAGQLTPVVGQIYPLAEAPVAMQHLIDGRARGKLVIDVTG